MIPGQGNLDQALTEAHAYLRRDAADTSREAALRALPRSATSRFLVLAAIVAADRMGLTDEEIVAKLHMSPNTARPRRLELVEGGWIEDSTRRRSTVSGADAIVWVLTEQGRDRWTARR